MKYAIVAFVTFRVCSRNITVFFFKFLLHLLRFAYAQERLLIFQFYCDFNFYSKIGKLEKYHYITELNVSLARFARLSVSIVTVVRC